MTTNFGLTEAELSMIKGVFKQHPKVEEVKIFGSRAKGNYRNNSDIDLVLIGQLSSLEAEEISSQLEDLPLPYFFDVKVFAAIKTAELLDHIGRVGFSIFRR